MGDIIGLELVCVHCGSPVNALFKQYSPSVLKLINCEECFREADKYIEYDNVIILIDLILFKTQAFRHIIYNSQFKNHWKLAILVFLMKTFDEWVSHCSPHKSSSLGPMVLEQTFYSSSMIILTGSCVYVAIVLAAIILYERKQLIQKTKSLKLYWKAVVLSNFGQFLLLPSLIWTDLNRQIDVMVVAIYCLLSQMQALSVVSSISRPALFMLLCTAVVGEQLVITEGRKCKNFT